MQKIGPWTFSEKVVEGLQIFSKITDKIIWVSDFCHRAKPAGTGGGRLNLKIFSREIFKKIFSGVGGEKKKSPVKLIKAAGIPNSEIPSYKRKIWPIFLNKGA